jgi:Arc/MetJ-type ribon-helix-helix transcriptional regulator
MGTITVRLDAEDERLLDQLVAVHGDRSTAVREAIRLLSGEEVRRKRLRAVLDAWAVEDGTLTQDELDETARRYGL